ncbi:hypothetical protein [Rhodocyclus gracilis]|uniref:Lipoprotein n=1 Tax=Rhodocyclus tenuis TaxID=1066 RepID=A0A6L5JXC5_RHOTE|nr:hypothetical protein [Rhodocyclus gracilis]MQY51284.1 hypothetical protein [Rhodocyclus gracilis]
MRSRGFVLAIAAAVALSGCSMFTPREGPGGEKLVYLKSIKRTGGEFSMSRNDGVLTSVFGVVGPAGAAVGAAADVVFGTAAASLQEPAIDVFYANHDDTLADMEGRRFFGADFFSRPAWEGSEKLYPKSWVILTSDKDGKLLLPCETPCLPVK